MQSIPAREQRLPRSISLKGKTSIADTQDLSSTRAVCYNSTNDCHILRKAVFQDSARRPHHRLQPNWKRLKGKDGERQPFVISGPGEYEVGGIFIKGFGTDTVYDKEKKINTVFSVMFEGINLCFLGSLASADSLSREVKEGLGEIDVLFTPISGGEEISASEAYKLTLALEAKVVVPMDFEHTKGSLETFVKESGAEAETMEKFTFKKKDLDGKEGEVVVLKSE
ncbi:MAG: Zn-dependent hydrolase of the beta-lactamase fold-like protein [Parcubacteria group bacterium GW2011_GWA1_44_13]|nr:MAG: Zn-dependent hydrolase of the beta-lactamase fold-like protein [Parcubacteria group bacterium GW2011_GWA1_44_13]